MHDRALANYLAGRFVAEDVAIELVSKCGCMHLIDIAGQAARRNHAHVFREVLLRTEVASVAAARHGSFSLVKDIVTHWRERCIEVDMCTAAARRGNARILRFLRDSGFKWDEQSAWGAARGGHCTIMKWLMRNGCPVDEFAVDAAVRSGSMQILRILQSRGLSVGEHCHVDTARAMGRVSMAKWLYECQGSC